jgi:hypothetical protein
MQAVERRGQVVAGAGERRRGGDFETDPVADARVPGALAGQFDRRLVVVRPGEPGRGYSCASRIVEAPRPQPISATVAPARSLSATPSRAGIQDGIRLAM